MRPVLQKRYILKEAASLLGTTLTHIQELICDDLVVPVLYAGDIELDDDKWIDGDWVPVVNAGPEFRKALGNRSDTIMARFRHYVVDDAKFDHWEERPFLISDLMISQKEIDKAKRYIPPAATKSVACVDGVAVFYHSADFTFVIYLRVVYHFSALQAHVIRKLIESFHRGGGRLKNDVLTTGLDFAGYDDQAKKVFSKNKKNHVFVDGGGFLDDSAPGYVRLALPRNVRFVLQD